MKSMTSKVFQRIRNRISQRHKQEGEDFNPGQAVDYAGPFSKEDLWIGQPRFREVSPENRPALLIRQLRLCSITFDFHEDGHGSSKDNLGKELKRQILFGLVDYITTDKNWFSELICQEVVAMISANLFRDLPPSTFSDYDPEEDEPFLDPAWPHLQLVYEFLLRFLVCTYTDVKILKKHIDKRFLINLINLFRSEDPRERDYLKTILHRTYGKFMSFRSFIRQAINNVFFDFVYNNIPHHGVSELLEILGSIINGLALPLKPEHQQFLKNVLIPMHKVKNLNQFHQQLAYCITQFCEKDPSVVVNVINGLLLYWPLQSSQKELLFLNELDEITDLASSKDLEQVAKPLFTKISKSIGSPHFQVAERALFLWNNDTIASFTSEQRSTVLPILYPALANNSKKHWNSTVHSLTFNIIRMFMDMDNSLFDEVAKNYDSQFDREQKSKVQRDNFWTTFDKNCNT